MKKQGELKSYICSIDGEHWTSFNATSYGHAKSQFLIYLDDCYGDCYLSIRCKCAGSVYTSEDFKRNAKYRGIEFAYCGMVVEVDGNKGVITGHNSSANLNVLFTDGKWKGQTHNCHPNWKITYFDKKGVVLKDFKNK
ncbi:hypothetical protein [Alistipes sp. ZOR0009]|uniref:hypothetical protein n=1 Tax=Alistipes sp. ZOR0009 TaxID=1339253 RepID=UPI00064655DD|nr:hypothetical protein [Alistipes sp. ZOR0009]